MLRYKTETKPGLVALYDIRPGNGVGLFSQPRCPHEAMLGLIGKARSSVDWLAHVATILLQIDETWKRAIRRYEGSDVLMGTFLVHRSNRSWT